MEMLLMDPAITTTAIGVLLTVASGIFAFAVRWLRSDIRDLCTDMNSDMRDLRSDMNSDIRDLCTDMNSDMRDLRSDMNSDMRDLRSDMNNLRTEVNDRFTAVETRITHEVGTLETKVDALDFKLDGLIMALANSGSLTYPPAATPSPATQPTSTETAPLHSSTGKAAG